MAVLNNEEDLVRGTKMTVLNVTVIHPKYIDIYISQKCQCPGSSRGKVKRSSKSLGRVNIDSSRKSVPNLYQISITLMYDYNC